MLLQGRSRLTGHGGKTVNMLITLIQNSPRRFFFLAAGLVVFLVGCGPSEKDLRQMAIRQYRDGQQIESMTTLRQLLEEDPSDPIANYYMGLNYRRWAERQRREGDKAGAIEELDTAVMYFTQAIKSWPNYMAAISAKNEALETRDKYEEAIEVAQRATEVNRGESEHFAYLGTEYMQRGDYDNALRCFKTSLDIQENAKAYAGLGELYTRVGNQQMAIDAYRRAYEMDPTNKKVARSLDKLASDSGTYTASDEAPLR
jgi:tetratricopeptide (TPR) repeat protein